MSLQPARESGRSPAAAPEDAGAPAALAEIFADGSADGAATGFALSHLRPGARVLWVQDRLSRREGGKPYVSGFGLPLEVLWLEVGRAVDALWAMEQALGCPALSAVVGEVWGDPPALDFTATKRLALRAEAHGVRAWLIRRAATPGLSAARERWQLRSLPSPPHPFDPDAPGEATWRATLFRARRRPPAEWVARRPPDPDRAAPVLVPTIDATLPAAQGGRRARA